MTSTVAAGLSTAWLALREPADAAARSTDLVELVRRARSPGPWVVHDLGAGTGSIGPMAGPAAVRSAGVDPARPRPVLLDVAVGTPPRDAADRLVSVTADPGELDDLTAEDLAGATAITASALLDMLTAPQVDRLCTVAAATGAVLLLTTTVTGDIRLHPTDPLDEAAAPCVQRSSAPRRPARPGRRVPRVDGAGLTSATG